MLKLLQISAASLALSVFAVAPAVLVISADTAVAKSDNGNGGGKGGGNGGGNKGGGKGKSADKGKGGEHKAKRTGSRKTAKAAGNRNLKTLGKQVKNGFGLFDGLKKKTARPTAARTTKAVSAPAAKAPASKVKAFDHPSNRGALNGAINSSPQAKLAHIKNGNFNGPVGYAAAYALADYTYRTASGEFTAARQTIEDVTTLNLLDLTPDERQAQIDQAASDLENGLLDEGTPEYTAARAAVEFDESQAQELRDSLAEGEEAELRDALAEAQTVEQPDLAALRAAEDNLIGLYKGDPSLLDEVDENDVTNREKLLDSINQPTDEQISAALDSRTEDEDVQTDAALIEDEAQTDEG